MILLQPGFEPGTLRWESGMHTSIPQTSWYINMIKNEYIYRLPSIYMVSVYEFHDLHDLSYTISSIYAKTKGPRTNLRPLFTNKLLKVATRRHFLSSLGIFWPTLRNFLKKWTFDRYNSKSRRAHQLIGPVSTHIR